MMICRPADEAGKMVYALLEFLVFAVEGYPTSNGWQCLAVELSTNRCFVAFGLVLIPFANAK